MIGFPRLRTLRKSSVPLYLCIMLSVLASCSGKKDLQRTDFRALARASLTLGFDIEEHDNHRLFLEAAGWIGTPYSYGGNTRQGIDCSGLSCNLYKDVFHIQLSRSSKEQYKKDCDQMHKTPQRLTQGDLVFFTTPGSKKDIGHVGVYLKDGIFIHASSSRGVVVDNLNDKYWKKNWLSGGSVRKR